MSEYLLYIYDDPVDGQSFNPKKTINLDDIKDDDKSVLQEWFPFDSPATPDQSVDYTKYAKTILDVSRTNKWKNINVLIGIGKRAPDINQRWRDGHPWLPGNLTEAVAIPIIQDNLYKEVKKIPELGKLSSDRIQSFSVKPIWRHPKGEKTNIDQPKNIFDDYASKLTADKLTTEIWSELVEVIVSQFTDILQVGTYGQHWENIAESNCVPHPDECSGLCGAWYIVEIQYWSGEDSITHKIIEVLVPGGLLKPEPPGGSNPSLVKVSFSEIKDVYTPGLDFRFLVPERQVSFEEFNNFIFWQKSAFANSDRNLHRNLREQLDDEKLRRPINQLKLVGSDEWRKAQGETRILAARNLAPTIVGKTPLAVFTKEGIHLLETENQIGEYCGRNRVLDWLWQPPPWSKDSPWLNEPLRKVYSTADKCYTKPSGIWPGGRAAIEDEVDDVPQIDGLNQFLTVLRSANHGITDYERWTKIIENVTIGAFRNYSCQERLKLINDLWEVLTEGHPFDKNIYDMYEPDYDEERSKNPLPTSWCPDPRGNKNYHKRQPGQIWKELGVGFRIEGEWGKKDDTLKRYKEKNGQGMTQWRLNKVFMLNEYQTDFTGTILDNLDEVRFWTSNSDILNETAVCVSRNFFGATLFPKRDSVGHFTLFALDCFHLKGFDTEQRQIDYKRPWRPGEKAFKQIPYEHVIGWVQIERTGGVFGETWCFKIADSYQWEFNPTWEEKYKGEDGGKYIEKRKSYIEAELDAWRGEHKMDGSKYDFA